MNYFERSSRCWDEVFALIRDTSQGRQVLSRFLCCKHPVRIETYPEDLRSRLLAVSSPGNPLGAAFVTNGEEGTIYVDMSSPIGILVPFLFHEMIHSLDSTLWKAAQQTLSSTQRNKIVFEAECLAFRAQHRFQEELKEIYPDLRRFHEIHYSHISFLNRALRPYEIAKLYQNR